MPETTHYLESKDCVLVHSFGIVELCDVQRSIAAAAELLAIHRTRKLMVDVREQDVSLDFVDTFDLCKKLLPELPADLKLAYIVNAPPRQSHRFFSMMSESLGCLIGVFHERRSAFEWLAGNHRMTKGPVMGNVKFPSQL